MRRREAETVHAPPELQAIGDPTLRRLLDDIYAHLPREGVGEPGADGANGADGAAGTPGADGHQFADRGDPSSADYTTFTLDGNWHDLDLSAIVPADTVLVLLRVTVNAGGGVNSTMQFRENGATNAINIDGVTAPVSETRGPYSVLVVPDASRVVEYRSQGTAPTSVAVTVGGWWV